MSGGHLPTLIRHLHHLAGPRHGGELTDRQLLERFARQRDEAAFAALVHRHADLVYGAGRRLLGHAQDAEDVFQATFLVLARKAGAVRWHDSAAPWLYDVARRLALKARADRQRRQPRERPAPPCPDAATEAARRELCDLLDEQVHRLPDGYRLPVLLCYFEGKTADQAARALGWSLRTLERRLGRARALLRARLTRRGVTLPAALLVASLSRQTAPAVLLGLTVRNAVLAASGEGAASLPASVASLFREGMSGTPLTSAKILAALALLLGGLTLALGHACRQQPPSPQQVEAPPAAPAKQARTDAHGDPLPAGALLRLGGLRFRHGDVVERLVYASDGKRLASAGGGAVCVWDADTGRLLHRFEGERDVAGFVVQMAFSPDGKALAFATLAGKVSLWDLITGKRLWQRAGSACFFLPDDKTLLTGGQIRLPDGTKRKDDPKEREAIHCWDLAGGDEVKPPVTRAHGWPLALSADGAQLATLTGGLPFLQGFFGPPEFKDATLHVWDTATGKELRRAAARHGRPEAAAFSPAGLTVLSRRQGKDQKDTPRLWDLANADRPTTLTGESTWVYFSHFSADGKRLIASGYDGGLRVWDSATGKELYRVRGPVDGVLRGSTFSPDGKTLAAGGEGRVVQFWDAATGEQRAVLPGHRGRVSWVGVSGDGRRLLSAGFDHTVRVWDAATGKPLRHWHHPGVPMWRAAYSPAGGVVASGPSEAFVWDPDTGRERRLARADGTVDNLAFSPDGKLVAGVGTKQPGAWVWAWDAATGKELWKLPSEHLFHSQAVAFAPDGRLLATAGGEGVIRLRESATGRPVRSFPEKVGPTVANAPDLAFAFSPDGRTILAVQQSILRLWETATGKERLRLEKAAPRLGCVAWSPDGRWAATGSPDGTVRLWEPLAGRERHRFEGHRGAVSSLAFSADGRTLISGSVDTTVLVWEVPRLRPTHGPGSQELSEEELARCRDDLASPDAARAYRAMGKLVAGRETVAYLSGRLRPAAAIEKGRLAALLDDLRSNRLEVRQRAAAEIEKLGDLAEPTLQAVLRGKPALEVRQRVEGLLARIATPAGESLQGMRAVEVLEHIGDEQAWRLLAALAKGEPDARLTREARESLARLESGRSRPRPDHTPRPGEK
jgi:RNA polymerase sigma factor (sigma-70 family)